VVERLFGRQMGPEGREVVAEVPVKRAAGPMAGPSSLPARSSG
jgi:hypothetical protein